MIKTPMDVELFLRQPVDIRKFVYYQLDGQFTPAKPDSLQELYCSKTVKAVTNPYRRTKIQKVIYNNLYDVFAPYISIFEYSPALIDMWLAYTFWLRYDCIVLDNLRLNHICAGTLIGQLDWIELDTKLRLAFFKHDMMHLWYTYREYLRWIVNKEPDIEIDYFGINLDNLRYAKLARVLHDLKRNEMMDLINSIFLAMENEIDTSDTDDLIDDTPHQLADPCVISIIKNMESMKNLTEIAIRGDNLYETLVNMHGVRDNPGKTISYIVRNRIKVIKLTQISNPALCDLTRWENLRELNITNAQDIDFNQLVLPKRCQVLSISKINKLTWWQLSDKIEARIQNNFIAKRSNSTTVRRINTSAIDDLAKIDECKAILYEALGSLNLIILRDVQQVHGNLIVVPSNLYDNKRILLHGSTMQAIRDIIVV